jgi:hypothetical protein
VDLDGDTGVADEFLRVWEQRLLLRDMVMRLSEQRMRMLHMTFHYDQEIPLDVAAHSASRGFAAMAGKPPVESQCHVIEMIARPYRLSLFAEKTGG